jgi:hypothetical protein
MIPARLGILHPTGYPLLACSGRCSASRSGPSRIANLLSAVAPPARRVVV